MAGNAVPRHFILTGSPGVGKTTLIKAIIQELTKKNIHCYGFYTEEIRTGGRRIGFDVITVQGERGELARVSDHHDSFHGARQKSYQVGQYSVNLASFEQIAIPTLLRKLNSGSGESAKALYIIDEIGKMELFSQSFTQTVDRLMSNPSNVVVATIPAQKGKSIHFVEKIRSSPSSKIYEVTKHNRDGLLDEIFPELLSQVTGSR